MKSDWTIDTLKQYVDVVFAERDKRDEQRFDAQKEAVSKAEIATEKRFDGVNEFRNTLSDQQTRLLNRTEYESNHSALIDKINAVTDRLNRMDGQEQGFSSSWGYIVGLIGVVAGIVAAISRFIK